ncbi:unnamed protein product [Urochloa decumbens]|uniref:Uncharacterized protein n=1 Tax=Urochloa decumbens TaxID=240449 RepID=A0ABC9H312_9POAL
MGDQQTKCSSSYARLAGLRRWPRPARGFRLSPARISVRRLRARLSTLLGFLGRYVRNLRLLTRGRVAAGSSSPPAAAATGGSRRFLIGGQKASSAAATGAKGAHHQATADNGSKAARRPPCMRSNSFYARAVAECLEFIKGSNVPLASLSPLAPPHGTPRRGGRC